MADGAPLVEMQRGKPARLSHLGRRVLAADERVRAALGGEFERLRAEIPSLLAEALPGARARLTLHASHDLALEPLRALCRSALELEVVVGGADESLAALARGECDLAGFHVADALPRAAAAAAALGRWLDPRKHALIHFVTRQQGLIARPGSRIRSLHDLAKPGVRFINRHMDMSVAAAVADGRADAGFGLRAEATRLKLAFVPLAMERYFFACARSSLRGSAVKTLLEILQGEAFAAAVKRLVLIGTVYPYGRPKTRPVREDHPRDPQTFKGRIEQGHRPTLLKGPFRRQIRDRLRQAPLLRRSFVHGDE